MSLKKVVPWFSVYEFDAVRERLFSDKISDKEWALGRIAVWRHRRPDVFSGFIESTCGIIRAQIADHHYRSFKGSEQSPMNVISLYSLAVLRFVAEVFEKLQNFSGLSKKDICTKMSLPDWIIDIRNATAHDVILPLEVFRDTCNVILRWMKATYWYRDSDKVLEISGTKQLLQQDVLTAAKIPKSISSYYKAAVAYYNNPNEHRNNARIIACKKLKTNIRRNERFFIDEVLLSSEGLMTKSFEDVQDGNTLDLDIFLKRTWTPILACLKDKLHELLFTMLTYPDQSEHWKRRTAAWVCYVACRNKQCGKIDLTKYIKPTDILLAAFRDPSDYTPIIMDVLTKNIKPALSSEQLRHLSALYSIYSGTCVDPRIILNRGLFTVKDLIKCEVAQTAAPNKEPVASSSTCNGWHRASERLPWSSTPIGFLPGAVEFDPESLMMKVGDLEPLGNEGKSNTDVGAQAPLMELDAEDSGLEDGDTKEVMKRMDAFYMNSLPNLINVIKSGYEA